MTRLCRIYAVAALGALLSACGAQSPLPHAGTGTQSHAAASQAAAGDDRTTLSYINLPAPYTFPWAFVNVPDGSLYFAEWGEYGNDGGIGRLNADGSIAEVDLGSAGNTPIPGAFDANGNLWFSNCGGFGCAGTDSFDFLSSSGAVTQYAADVGSHPRFSVVDPNGNAWFPLARTDAVARVSPNGTITQFPLPLGAYNRANPNDIVLGPDGACGSLTSSATRSFACHSTEP